MASIRFEAISKNFGPTAVLTDVSLTIKDGEFLSLLGPSGCGKTTLLRILAGLEAQSEGEVSIAGTVVDDLPPKQRDVAMVFQNYALYPYMTVWENVALPLVMRRLSTLQRLPLIGYVVPGCTSIRAGIDRDVLQTCQGLGLAGLLERKPAQLSGGQRQRVALARAMVRQPSVFLMDEPLSNLDARLRTQARTEIAELHRRLGTTFIYVTHDQTEAMTMSDRVAVMLEGKVIQVGPPQELYADPQTLSVASFIGTPQINVIPGKIESDGAISLPGGLILPIQVAAAGGSIVQIGFRPEDLSPSFNAGGFTGRITHVEHLGSEVLAHFAVAGLTASLVARMAPGKDQMLRIGNTIGLTLKTEAALIFDAAGQRLPSAPRAATSHRKLPLQRAGSHG